MLDKNPEVERATLRKAAGALKSAFKYFGLDPQHAEDWDRLRTIVLASGYLNTRRGRPKGSRIWTTDRLLALALGLALSDLPAPETLRKRLAEARRVLSFTEGEWAALKRLIAVATIVPATAAGSIAWKIEREAEDADRELGKLAGARGLKLDLTRRLLKAECADNALAHRQASRS